ncbi:Cypemycin N-terminal methyltransferase [Ascidiaceihabitans donghaensis]|uniref:Cypemycin N-terminal methyltransferase n=1 Tax=Ascidiaceihabitans donghaensis TaxID=1510460 RepID=A0A2R8BHM6_9RHOB|nr:class I SAM-dependent methyltransferase [Ascidiaceihabitans donghaensis]SPH22606.1 Cypemycin N-terminal methyltransferase [Ascidiaceihabitans donghaensis]
MTDTETLNVYAQKAQDYADLTVEGTRKDKQLLGFLAALPPGGTVLDIGCGPGHASGQIAQAGFRVIAMDPVREMVDLAEQQNGVSATQGTFDDVTSTDCYDGIWANFSMLHVPRADVPRHLRAIATALKPGGVFHIGVKLGSGEKRDPIGRLYTYFTEPELETLLGDVNLTITDRSYGSDKGLDGVMADWICLRAYG